MPTEAEIQQRYDLLKFFAKASKTKLLLAQPADTREQVAELSDLLALAFLNWCAVGFCEWRHRLAPSRKALARAHKVATFTARCFASHDDPVKGEPWFWFSQAAYVARLVTGTFPADLLARLPPFDAWRQVSGIRVTFVDVGHLVALTTGRYPADWDDLCAAFAAQFQGKAALAMETHDCYRQLIAAATAGETGRALAVVVRLDELFLHRADDPFYADSPSWEGYDLNNPYAVDYRLAAILLHCAEAGMPELATVPSPHRWPGE